MAYGLKACSCHPLKVHWAMSELLLCCTFVKVQLSICYTVKVQNVLLCCVNIGKELTWWRKIENLKLKNGNVGILREILKLGVKLSAFVY